MGILRTAGCDPEFFMVSEETGRPIIPEGDKSLIMIPTVSAMIPALFDKPLADMFLSKQSFAEIMSTFTKKKLSLSVQDSIYTQLLKYFNPKSTPIYSYPTPRGVFGHDDLFILGPCGLQYDGFNTYYDGSNPHNSLSSKKGTNTNHVKELYLNPGKIPDMRALLLPEDMYTYLLVSEDMTGFDIYRYIAESHNWNEDFKAKFIAVSFLLKLASRTSLSRPPIMDDHKYIFAFDVANDRFIPSVNIFDYSYNLDLVNSQDYWSYTMRMTTTPHKSKFEYVMDHKFNFFSVAYNYRSEVDKIEHLVDEFLEIRLKDYLKFGLLRKGIRDNVLWELHSNPGACAAGTVGNFGKNLFTQAILHAHKPIVCRHKARLTLIPAYEFPPEELAIDPQAQLAGCNPEWQIIGDRIEKVPAAPLDGSWRTAGGHIQFGEHCDYYREADISMYNQLEASPNKLPKGLTPVSISTKPFKDTDHMAITKAMDCVIGVFSVAMTPQDPELERKRRELGYGKPSSHRFKVDAVTKALCYYEYRVPSANFYITPFLFWYGIQLGRSVFSLVGVPGISNKIEKIWEEARDIINNHDVERARAWISGKEHAQTLTRFYNRDCCLSSDSHKLIRLMDITMNWMPENRVLYGWIYPILYGTLQDLMISPKYIKDIWKHFGIESLDDNTYGSKRPETLRHIVHLFGSVDGVLGLPAPSAKDETNDLDTINKEILRLQKEMRKLEKEADTAEKNGLYNLADTKLNQTEAIYDTIEKLENRIRDLEEVSINPTYNQACTYFWSKYPYAVYCAGALGEGVTRRSILDSYKDLKTNKYRMLNNLIPEHERPL